MALPTEIDRTINQAIDHLQRTRPANTEATPSDDGLLYLGPWHDAYPAILVRDPFLTDSAKIQWLYLAQEARRQPAGAIGMPSIQETSRTLHQARGTVIRDRLLLRICRWISTVRQVRDAKTGRFLGQIYAMHGEPIQLHAAIEYDDQYLDMIERSSDHQDKCIQRAAHANILGIQQQIVAGEDPLAPVDQTTVRITSATSIKNDWGITWGMALNSETPGPKFEPGDDPSLEFGRGKNPGSNSGPGQIPSPNFGLGSQLVDSKSGSNFGPGVCSSSCNKTTTTKLPSPARANSEANRASLNWPAALDDNLRRIIDRTLTLKVAVGHHQDVLDALAHKLLDQSNPLRNPVGYAIKLCERIQSGTFQPVGPPLQASAPIKFSERPPNNTLTHSQLRNELSSLKQLRAVSGVGSGREILDRQVGDIESKLYELDTGCPTKANERELDTLCPTGVKD